MISRHSSDIPPPLPFITSSASDPRKFEVGAEAVAFLCSLPSRSIAPVVIAGRYRTGKSFLLNRLSGGARFGVGGTVSACTRGIWLSPHVLPSADPDAPLVLYLDTEGLGSTGATSEHDARIFSLATLLASLIVYNSIGAIDEESLSQLSFVSSLTRVIQVRRSDGGAVAGGVGVGASSGSPRAQDDRLLPGTPDKSRATAAADIASAELSMYAPSFLWVLRDFSLSLHDEAGDEMTTRDYLESALLETEGFSTELQARNRVRRALVSFFRERDCATLVRPADDEAALADAEALPESAFRREFREGLAALRMRIAALARPKIVHGAHVTGPMLAALAVSYVDAINSGSVPSIGDAWSCASSAACAAAVGDAFSIAEAAIARDAATLPMEESELRAALERAAADAHTAFRARAVGPSAESSRADLVSRLGALASRVLEENARSSGTGAARAVARLWSTHVEPVFLTSIATAGVGAGDALADHAEEDGVLAAQASNTQQPLGAALEFALDNFRELFKSSARGPGAAIALADFLLSEIPSLVRDASTAVSAAAAAKIAAMRARALAGEAAAAESGAAAIAAASDAAIARTESAASHRAVVDAEASLASLRTTLREREAELVTARAAVDAAAEEATSLRASVKIERSRADDAAAGARSVAAELASVRAETAAALSAASAASAEAARQRLIAERADATAVESTGSLAALHARVASAETAASDAQIAAAIAGAEAAHARAAAERAEADRVTAAAAHVAEVAALRGALEAATRRADAAALGALSDRDGRLAAALAARAAADADAAAARADREAARDDAAAARAAVASREKEGAARVKEEVAAEISLRARVTAERDAARVDADAAIKERDALRLAVEEAHAEKAAALAAALAAKEESAATAAAAAAAAAAATAELQAAPQAVPHAAPQAVPHAAPQSAPQSTPPTPDSEMASVAEKTMKERDAARVEAEQFAKERDAAILQREAASRERDDARAERDAAILAARSHGALDADAESSRALANLAASARHDRDEALAARDAATAACALAKADHEKAVAEHSRVDAEAAAVRASLRDALAERDAALADVAALKLKQLSAAAPPRSDESTASSIAALSAALSRAQSERDTAIAQARAERAAAEAAESAAEKAAAAARAAASASGGRAASAQMTVAEENRALLARLQAAEADAAAMALRRDLLATRLTAEKAYLAEVLARGRDARLAPPPPQREDEKPDPRFKRSTPIPTISPRMTTTVQSPSPSLPLNRTSPPLPRGSSSRLVKFDVDSDADDYDPSVRSGSFVKPVGTPGPQHARRNFAMEEEEEEQETRSKPVAVLNAAAPVPVLRIEGDEVVYANKVNKPMTQAKLAEGTGCAACTVM